jgi:hypothetical protein
MHQLPTTNSQLPTNLTGLVAGSTGHPLITYWLRRPAGDWSQLQFRNWFWLTCQMEAHPNIYEGVQLARHCGLGVLAQV